MQASFIRKEMGVNLKPKKQPQNRNEEQRHYCKEEEVIRQEK